MPAQSRKTKNTPGTAHIYLLSFLVLLCGWFSSTFPLPTAVKAISMPVVLPIILVAAVFFVVRTVFLAANYTGEPVLPPLVLLLSGIGFLIQLRLGTLQLTGVPSMTLFAWPIGLAAFLASWIVFRNGRHARLHKMAIPCHIAASAILLAIALTGHRYRGGIFLAGQFNPSEIIKPLLAVFLAGLIVDFKKPLARSVAGIPTPPFAASAMLVGLWLIPVGLLVVLRDLGMVMLLNIVLLLLVFMVTGRWGYLAAGAAFAAAAFTAGFRMFGHARVRFDSWLNPFDDPTGGSWQILQSLSAMFSGGLFGSGLGRGAPSSIPIAASDFVYAVLAEETGFAGCILIALVYLLVIYTGYRAADHHRQPFPRTLAAALATMLAVQVLMNIGGVTKAIPLTGITLPLISHGGSSLVISLVMLGMLAALSETDGPGRTTRGPDTRPPRKQRTRRPARK